MNKRTTLAVACLALTVLLSGCQQQASHTLLSTQAEDTALPAQQVSKRTRSAAQAVLASFTADQREKAVRPIDNPLRKDWHFIPRERQGVALGDLDAKQKTLVHELMQTALSDSGYLKATDIIWLETVLFEMSNENPMRDPGKYALLIFGDPADESAAWGWRLEGHHLSLNLTYTPEGIGVTPLFFGTNPAVVPEGPLAGKRVLADAHNHAVELAKSMSEEQREEMMLAEKPRDVITGPGREKMIGQSGGIAVADLNAQQRAAVERLFDAHLRAYEKRHESRLHRQMMEKNDNHDHLMTFSWAGPIDADQPFYYRLQSRQLLIEYSCQGRNHVHAVIHDLTDPLQQDLIKKHFEQHEHE